MDIEKKNVLIGILRDWPNVSNNDIRNILESIASCYDNEIPDEKFLINELMSIAQQVCPKEYNKENN